MVSGRGDLVDGPGRGPLILGAGGRVGRMFRHLAAQGLWPGPEPVWHTRDGRDGTLGWDIDRHGSRPDWGQLPSVAGIVVLAGQTKAPPGRPVEDAEWAAARLGLANERPALAAQALARHRGIERVLLCSSAAVYGAASGPQREEVTVRPATAYGRAKQIMEQGAEDERRFHRGTPPTCALRIGNVAGADALFGAMAQGPVTLDRLPDGAAPRRAYIGPLTLARALVALLARPDLPPVLNLAQPGLLPMSDLLRAAGHPFAWRPAPPTALPTLEMDLSRLLALVPLPPATPGTLVAEARVAGWRPFGGDP